MARSLLDLQISDNIGLSSKSEAMSLSAQSISGQGSASEPGQEDQEKLQQQIVLKQKITNQLYLSFSDFLLFIALSGTNLIDTLKIAGQDKAYYRIYADEIKAIKQKSNKFEQYAKGGVTKTFAQSCKALYEQDSQIGVIDAFLERASNLLEEFPKHFLFTKQVSPEASGKEQVVAILDKLREEKSLSISIQNYDHMHSWLTTLLDGLPKNFHKDAALIIRDYVGLEATADFSHASSIKRSEGLMGVLK